VESSIVFPVPLVPVWAGGVGAHCWGSEASGRVWPAGRIIMVLATCYRVVGVWWWGWLVGVPGVSGSLPHRAHGLFCVCGWCGVVV
jgi:hypothetical protein